MSSFNTPAPPQPNNLPRFLPLGIPHEQKFRSKSDLLKITERFNLPANFRPHHLHRPQPVPPKDKTRSMEDLLKTAKAAVTPYVYYAQLCCKICGSGDKGEEMLLCDKCDKGFHMMCLTPVVSQVPLGKWFCDDCRPSHSEGMCHSVIVSTRNKASQSRKRYFGIIQYISPEGPRRRSKRICLTKNRTKILPYIPSKDRAQRNRQLDSLRSAMKNRNLEFSDELTYPEGMAPKSANQSKSECDDMQVLSKENMRSIEKCKEMYKRGKCPPLRVVFDQVEGYKVEADDPIKAMTFISEYTGDVDFFHNRPDDDFDSFMTLLTFRDSSDGDGLLICPDKRGNIARFISGINNQSAESRKNKNITSLRYNVNGECRVFLITSRHIKEGERLCYDYNGQENAFPTEHFI